MKYVSKNQEGPSFACIKATNKIRGTIGTSLGGLVLIQAATHYQATNQKKETP
jgi:hypothetical protein